MAWGQGYWRADTSPNGLGQQPACAGGAALPNPSTWAFGVGYLHPYAEVSIPLGAHLHLATKEKKWMGEYVNLFSLLFLEPELKPWVSCRMVATEMEQYRHPK